LLSLSGECSLWLEKFEWQIVEVGVTSLRVPVQKIHVEVNYESVCALSRCFGFDRYAGQRLGSTVLQL
jgi:hypothetical protein